MATINNQPSVFITPETPANVQTAITAENTDYQTYLENEVRIASELVEDEVDFDDPEFQESYNEWCEKLDEEWRNDPVAQAEFDEWCNEQERIERQVSELETLEHEAYEEHIEAQAEEAELARLGEAYLIAANTNHDAIWQNGGQV